MISTDDLHAILPASARIDVWVEPLNAAMAEFDINTPQREAAFLAQTLHESGGFRYVREIAPGDAYEGRSDLGNTEPGDGVRFKGRGILQITGRANYAACGVALGLDLLANPELLEEPILACRSAAWFWKRRGLNELADKGDFQKITKRINGGLTHYRERVGIWDKAKDALGVA